MLKQQIAQAKNWENRFRLIIQASRKLTIPTEQERQQMQAIPGCEAALWFQIIADETSQTFHFKAYSEARIMNGLLYLLLQEINGKTAEELATFNIIAFFDTLGITQRLSNTRQNGLKNINQKLKHL